MKKLGVVVVLVLACVLPAAAAPLPITAPHDWWPVPSPSGTLLAFTRVNGQGRLFTLEVASVAAGQRAPRRLAQSSYQLLPSWSPDSQRIAYQSGGRIWTIGAGGSGRREVGDGLFPAWSPDGKTIAFVQGGVVHAGATRLGAGVTGVPVWSPDGRRIAFPQSDGVYVATVADGDVQRVAAPVAEVRNVIWSPDGKSLAYAAAGSVYEVGDDGAGLRRLAGAYRNVGPLAWSGASDELAFTTGSALVSVRFDGAVEARTLARTFGIGTSYGVDGTLFFSGPNPRCAGHDAIRVYPAGVLAGSCAILGTAGADRISGTSAGGDVISGGAGSDSIRARNGRRDRVDCGAGRDTAWVDRSDTVTHCEVVHR